MDFSAVPEPWGIILQLIVGPVGAIILLCLISFFLWRLFREEQKENRANMVTVQTLAETIKDLRTELRSWSSN